LTTLASDTAYHSFAGEVEARTPPRYAAFIPSGRHQLSPIARRGRARTLLSQLGDAFPNLILAQQPGSCDSRPASLAAAIYFGLF